MAVPPSDELPLDPLEPLPLEPLPLEPLPLEPLPPECEPLLTVPLAEPAVASPLDPLLAPLWLPAEPPDEPLGPPADAAPLEAPLSLPDATEKACPPHANRKAPAKGMSGMSRHGAVRFAIVLAPRTRKLIERWGSLAPLNCTANARAAPPEQPAAPHWGARLRELCATLNYALEAPIVDAGTGVGRAVCPDKALDASSAWA